MTSPTERGAELRRLHDAPELLQVVNVWDAVSAKVVGRIVASTDLPVSADLEAGYGDAGGTIRRAIGVGAVGANLEDQVRPFDDAVAQVRAAVAAAEAEGVPFALNARTDVWLQEAWASAGSVSSVARDRRRRSACRSSASPASRTARGRSASPWPPCSGRRRSCTPAGASPMSPC